MCGIAGILGTSDGFAVDEELVTTMRELIHHRGPDDGGSWHSPEDRVALAHRRLSIIDLRPAGHQPMSNEDGTVWITFGGEIYNHLEHPARARGEGPPLPLAHGHRDDRPPLRGGGHPLPRAAARDVRTSRSGTRARASSSSRATASARSRSTTRSRPAGSSSARRSRRSSPTPRSRAELDEEAFFHYLTFVCTPAPMTMFKGIRKLGPGRADDVRADGSTEIETLLDAHSPSRPRTRSRRWSEPELEERLLALLRESIRQPDDVRRPVRRLPLGRRRLVDERRADVRADGRAGAHLLGRLRAVRALQRARARADDRAQVRHRPPRGRDRRARPRVVPAGADLPPGRADRGLGRVPLHYVSKLARDNGTVVVQIGEGSDELFHGYQSYHSFARFAQPLPAAPPGTSPAPRSRRAASGLAFRTGKLVPHAQAVEEAAAGRIPFWGGAIAYQGELKDRVLTQRPRASGLVRRRRALCANAERECRRRPAAEDDLPRAQEPPRRAAADAGRQDDDGGTRSRLAFRSSTATSSSSRWRCRPR